MISTTYCLIMSETLAETWETCRWREWSRKNLSLLMSQNWVLIHTEPAHRASAMPAALPRKKHLRYCYLLGSPTVITVANTMNNNTFSLLCCLPWENTSLPQFSATTLCSWHTLCKAVPDQSSLRHFHFHLKKARINVLQTNAFWDPGSLCSHTCLVTGMFPYLSEFCFWFPSL